MTYRGNISMGASNVTFRKMMCPFRTAFLLAAAAAAVFICWPPVRSIVVGYEPSAVRTEDLSEARFTCPATERTLVIRDPDRLKAVASMFRKLRRFVRPPGGYGKISKWTPDSGTVVIYDAGPRPPIVAVISRVQFKDGGFLYGYWELRPDPYHVSYLPDGVITELDPAPYYHPNEARDDPVTLALVQELMALCEDEEPQPPVEAPR